MEQTMEHSPWKQPLEVLGPDGGVDEDLTDYVLEDDANDPSGGRLEEAQVVEAAREQVKTVYDPEIPVNIYDLGLIYGLDLDETGLLHCRMTLTAPGCPVAGSLVREVHAKLLQVPGLTRVKTELVWDPPWTRERMSEEALLQLGLF